MSAYYLVGCARAASVMFQQQLASKYSKRRSAEILLFVSCQHPLTFKCLSSRVILPRPTSVTLTQPRKSSRCNSNRVAIIPRPPSVMLRQPPRAKCLSFERPAMTPRVASVICTQSHKSRHCNIESVAIVLRLASSTLEQVAKHTCVSIGLLASISR